MPYENSNQPWGPSQSPIPVPPFPSHPQRSSSVAEQQQQQQLHFQKTSNVAIPQTETTSKSGMTIVENLASPFYNQSEFLHRDPLLFPSVYDETGSPRLPRNNSSTQLFSLVHGRSSEGIPLSLSREGLNTPTSTRIAATGSTSTGHDEDFSSEQYLARVLPSFEFEDLVVEDITNLPPSAALDQASTPAYNIAKSQETINTSLIPSGALTSGTNNPVSTTNTSAVNTAPEQYPFYVVLKHKPRGSKGQWQNIEPGERIRVDKRKGKIVQLSIKTTVPLDSSWNVDTGVKVNLLDLRSPYYVFEEELPPVATGPTVRPVETSEEKKQFGPNASIREIHLKVRMGSISKKQMFHVSLLQGGVVVASGKTIEFCSDDNGKLYTPVGRKRRKPRKEEEEAEAEVEAEEQHEEEAAAPNPPAKQMVLHSQPENLPLSMDSSARTKPFILDAFGGPPPSVEAFFQNISSSSPQTSLFSSPNSPYEARDSEAVSAKRQRLSNNNNNNISQPQHHHHLRSMAHQNHSNE